MALTTNFVLAQGYFIFKDTTNQLIINDSLQSRGYLKIGGSDREGLSGDLLLGKDLNQDAGATLYICKDTDSDRVCGSKILTWAGSALTVNSADYNKIQLNEMGALGITAGANTYVTVAAPIKITNASGTVKVGSSGSANISANTFYIDSFAPSSGQTIDLSASKYKTINLGPESNLKLSKVCTLDKDGAGCVGLGRGLNTATGSIFDYYNKLGTNEDNLQNGTYGSDPSVYPSQGTKPVAYGDFLYNCENKKWQELVITAVITNDKSAFPYPIDSKPLLPVENTATFGQGDLVVAARQTALIAAIQPGPPDPIPTGYVWPSSYFEQWDRVGAGTGTGADAVIDSIINSNGRSVEFGLITWPSKFRDNDVIRSTGTYPSAGRNYSPIPAPGTSPYPGSFKIYSSKDPVVVKAKITQILRGGTPLTPPTFYGIKKGDRIVTSPVTNVTFQQNDIIISKDIPGKIVIINPVDMHGWWCQKRAPAEKKGPQLCCWLKIGY